MDRIASVYWFEKDIGARHTFSHVPVVSGIFGRLADGQWFYYYWSPFDDFSTHELETPSPPAYALPLHVQFSGTMAEKPSDDASV